MKVILAGMPKTGTTTMASALDQLGFKVLDFFEHHHIHEKEWNKIMEYGGTTEDFHSMYKDIDAVADSPPCHFWEEIYKAFPDCKIILTFRDNDDVWFESYSRQIRAWNTTYLLYLYATSPTAFKHRRFIEDIERTMHGTRSSRYLDRLLFRRINLNPVQFKMTYRMHNSYLIHTVPKDKLLLYNVKQGWKPLCDFLNVDIPSTPFPHKNIKGSEVQDFMDNDPLFRQMRREMIITTSLIVMFLAMFFYWLFCAFA